MTGGLSQYARVIAATMADPNTGKPWTDAQWAEHNRQFDEKLAAWNEAERELSQAHIDLARDLQRDIAAIGDA